MAMQRPPSQKFGRSLIILLGQRLAPLLKSEVSRLRQLEEISIPNEARDKLEQISPATIDRKLKHQREVLSSPP